MTNPVKKVITLIIEYPDTILKLATFVLALCVTLSSIEYLVVTLLKIEGKDLHNFPIFDPTFISTSLILLIICWVTLKISYHKGKKNETKC